MNIEAKQKNISPEWICGYHESFEQIERQRTKLGKNFTIFKMVPKYFILY